MEDERLLLRFKPALNPRAGVMESSAAALGQQQQKPPPSTSILERFRALVKEVGGGGEEEQVSGEEIVGIYEEVLGELTFNSKPVITELTIIAGEQREFGQGIADVICERILQVPVEQKLPSLYLLDSIVKNIGRDYVKYFTARLPQVFCEAYNQVESCLHPSMRHLFGTWSQVFPSSVLRKIETELQLSSQGSRQSSGVGNVRPSESPSPRPGHGIHINPKYLEARQQFEQSTMTRGRVPRDSDQITEFGGAPVGRNAAESPRGWSGASSKFHDIQHHKGISSSLDPYEQKAQYGDYDLDNSVPIPSLSGSTRISSLPVPEGCPTAILGNEKLLSFSKSDVFKSSAPSTTLRMSDTNGWRESNTSPDDGFQKPEYQNAYNLANGISKHRPRDLIDAYGNNRGKNVLPEKPLKIQRLNANGINTEKITRKWQNTEEEEYVWEDMSPTLANRNGSNKIIPYGPNAGDFGIRTNLSRPNASVLDSDFGKSKWPLRSQLPPVDEPAPSNSGLMRSQRGVGRNDISHYQSSQYTQEPRKSHYVPSQSQQSLSPRSQGRIPLSVSGIATVGQRIPPYHRISDAEVPFERSPGIFPDSMNAGLLSSTAMDNRVAQKSKSPPAVSVIWPPVHKSQSLAPSPVPPQQMEYGSQPDSVGISRPLGNQGPPSFPLHWQLPDAGDRKASNPNIPIRITHSGPGSIPLNIRGLEPVLQFQPRDPHGNIIPSASAQTSSHLVGQSLNQVQVQGQPSIQSLVPPNSELSSSSFLMNRLPDTSFHTHGGALPPLPPGPPPSMAHIAAHNSGSLISTAPGSGFSGLISSLVSQGLISLGPVTSSKDSIGVEFDSELLKVRHESAINDLYVNLPRQCTTCGLRFRCQEEHSSHMDWHVTKNRMSKNRKQKPSRNWFVSAKEWLSGAETLGTDVVPGFLPTETIADKDEEKELAVPADDSQNLCALCGEPFEDFYSDEADEWMYRGAVYLNAHEGSIEGLDRSQLGPIVHAKCRSESTVIQRQS